MSVEVPQDEIRSVISKLSGVPESRINWDGEPERAVGLWGAAGQAGKITLSVVARLINGADEMRVVDDVEIVTSNRILTIGCRADNFLKMGDAFDTLEKIRIGLFRRSARKTLRDAGLAFVDAQTITTLDYDVDNRVISSATLDLRLSQTVTDAPPQDGSLDQTVFIEKASRKAPEDIPDPTAEPVVYLPFKFP